MGKEETKNSKFNVKEYSNILKKYESLIGASDTIKNFESEENKNKFNMEQIESMPLSLAKVVNNFLPKKGRYDESDSLDTGYSVFNTKPVNRLR